MPYIAPSIVLDPVEIATLKWPVFLWDNLLTSTAITADEEDANYPASNLANPQTWSIWKALTTGAQDLLFDVDPSDPIDSVGISRHNWGSAAIAITISGITADDGAVFETLAELAPGSDSPILAIFESGYYVQIKISLSAGSIIPRAAVVYIGTLLRMPRGIPPGHMPLFDARETTMLSGVAENGDFLGDIIVSEQLSSTVNFEMLDGDWYRENMRAFVQSRKPFFFAWAPTDLPDEMGYAKFSGSPKPTISQATGEVSISLPMIGLAL